MGMRNAIQLIKNESLGTLFGSKCLVMFAYYFSFDFHIYIEILWFDRNSVCFISTNRESYVKFPAIGWCCGCCCAYVCVCVLCVARVFVRSLQTTARLAQNNIIINAIHIYGSYHMNEALRCNAQFWILARVKIHIFVCIFLLFVRRSFVVVSFDCEAIHFWGN